MTRLTEESIYESLSRNGVVCINADCRSGDYTSFTFELETYPDTLPSEVVTCPYCSTSWKVTLCHGGIDRVYTTDGTVALPESSLYRKLPSDWSTSFCLDGRKQMQILQKARNFISAMTSPLSAREKKAKAIAEMEVLIPDYIKPE